MDHAPQLKAEILRLPREYSALSHLASRTASDALRGRFVPARTTVP